MNVLPQITRAIVVTVLALALVAAASAQSRPRSAREYPLHIERQALTQALQELSQQTGVQHGYLPTDNAEEMQLIGPVHGRYTIDDALHELLPPGFEYEWIDNRTLSVIPPRPNRAREAAGAPNSYEDGLDRRLRERLSTPHRVVGIIDRVLVTHSRVTDLALELPSATIVLDRQAIESLGVSTVTDAMAYISQLPYTRPEFNLSGEQRAELRGLGQDTTLVLINGRRAGGSSAALTVDAFDLNTMPLAAVERIEVYLDEVPFEAGANAIGGMINIVLKSEARPPQVDVNFGWAEGGAAENRASITAGEARDRWRVTTALDYFERSELTGAERDRWRNQDYRRYGGTDWRSISSNPGNVSSVAPTSLPGLPTRFAAVPLHVSGEPLTVEDFLTTSGKQNLDSLRRFRSIVPERRRISAVMTAEWRAPGATRAFGELFYTNGDTLVHELPATLSNVVVPATNPWNPFGVPVAVSFLPEIGPRRSTTEAKYFRALAGIDGQARKWHWGVEVLHTHDSTHRVLEQDLNPLRVAEALARSERSQALNPFDDGPGGREELIANLTATPTLVNSAYLDTEWRAHLTGDSLQLPAGGISTRIGFARRESTITSSQATLAGSAHRSIDSAFVEVAVPVIDSAMRVPGIVDLSLTASGRIDSYSDLGSQSHSQWTLRWQPLRQLTIRGTYATVYRPPSLHELNQKVQTIPVSALDLRRGNEVASFMLTAGGNSELDTTTAKNWSVGIGWAPESTLGFQGLATYWNSRSVNRVSPVVLPVLLANEELFPGRVTRGTRTESDIAAGLPGVLTAIDVTLDNVGSLAASGVDVSLSFDVASRLGRIKPTLSATWMDGFRVVDLPGTQSVERVGLASLLGTIPNWRGSTALTWSVDALSATTVLRYISAYHDFNVLTNARNGRRRSAQVLLDIQAEWRFPGNSNYAALVRDLTLSAGATNVLDRMSPFAEVGIDSGYDVSQGDLKGRFVYLRLAKRF